MLQKEAIEKMKTGINTFLTGAPGSGKSYTLNIFLDWCLDNGKVPVVTSSTGVSAIQIGGITLHSFVGVRDENATLDDIEHISKNFFLKQKHNLFNILIVDEISMISDKMLDLTSRILQKTRNNPKPFGGMQVVFVGDFYQLPPVSGKYAFTSDEWKRAELETCYLTEQHRTHDTVFIEILRSIRAGEEIKEEHKELLRQKAKEDVSGVDAIRLETHNINVDTINETRLARLTGMGKGYKMVTSGNDKLLPAMIKHCQSPEFLVLKVGAPVMFTKNDKEQRWVNGTRGTIVEMGEKEVTVSIHGTHVKVTQDTWEYATGYGTKKQVLASISQIPLRLAWAITVHKSQGMTLDNAIIDVTKAFATGQGYVAISRVRSLEGLYFQGKLSKNVFMVSNEVKQFEKQCLNK